MYMGQGEDSHEKKKKKKKKNQGGELNFSQALKVHLTQIYLLTKKIY